MMVVFRNSFIPIFNQVGLFIAEQFLKEDYKQTNRYDFDISTV